MRNLTNKNRVSPNTFSGRHFIAQRCIQLSYTETTIHRQNLGLVLKKKKTSLDSLALSSLSPFLPWFLYQYSSAQV